MSKIIMFTMYSAHEVIATLVEDEGASYVISKPLIVSAVQTSADAYGLRMDPFSMANPDGDQRVFKSAIAMEAVKVPDGLEKAYLRQTSTIEIVSSLPGQM